MDREEDLAEGAQGALRAEEGAHSQEDRSRKGRRVKSPPLVHDTTPRPLYFDTHATLLLHAAHTKTEQISRRACFPDTHTLFVVILAYENFQ